MYYYVYTFFLHLKLINHERLTNHIRKKTGEEK